MQSSLVQYYVTNQYEGFTMTIMEFEAIEHETVCEALQYTEVSSHDTVMRIGRRIFSMAESESDRIIEAGVEAAILCYARLNQNGQCVERIVSIPVNDNGIEVEIGN